MSHQGYPGWFPECLLCGLGNLDAVICLNPMCHQSHDGKRINSFSSILIQKDDHWWKLCQLCEGGILSDPVSFGVFALCVDCFNKCIDARIDPPTTPSDAAVTREKLRQQALS